MIKNINRYIVIGLCIVLLASCNSNRLKIDVSNITIPPVKVERLEKDMFSMPVDSIYQYSPRLEKKYGKFYARFVIDIVFGGGGVMDSSYAASLRRFITDNDLRHVYDTCERIYPDMKFLESGLTDAFKHFKYYFPDRQLPKVITAISGFNNELAYFDSTLEISLDWYMGTKSPFYIMLRWPDYKVMHLSKDYMLSDAIYGWLQSIFKPNENKNDMLSAIIHEGKIRYLQDALLPEVDDTIKMWYTKKQMEYCKQFEFNVWAKIIEKNLLYSTDPTNITKYTEDGPFIAEISHECPSRIGNWYGWQIVRNYMAKNSKVTLAQLMDETDADKILRKSGYKPKK